MNNSNQSFVLLFKCVDRQGIVAGVSDFIFKRGGNIIDAGQYTTDPEHGLFFMRTEFSIDRNRWNKEKLTEEFVLATEKVHAECKIYDKLAHLLRGILVSRPGQCLLELLYLWKSKELDVKIPFVISNFEEQRSLVESYGVPFYFIPATKDNSKEEEILDIVKQESDFLVLARYMIMLSPRFLKEYGKDIVNIHHGLLPSFKGPDPYQQAFEKGVKVIGATAHFANEFLDEGPIISQQVEHVTHKDDAASLSRKGRNLEKRALADSVLNYTDYRVIRHDNKTVVFENW